MLVIKKLIVVNLKLLAKITPKFFNRVTLVFHGLQKPLHLFVVGCGAFNGSGFRGILVFLTDAANDPIQIAVDVMEEVFLFVDAGSVQNLFTITKFSGVDPATYQVNGLNPGASGGRSYYPSTRQFIFGVQLDF